MMEEAVGGQTLAHMLRMTGELRAEEETGVDPDDSRPGPSPSAATEGGEHNLCKGQCGGGD